jgi:Kef-type K+ transport system membrane component KefB
MALVTGQDTTATLEFFLGICMAMSAVPIISRVINDYGDQDAGGMVTWLSVRMNLLISRILE